MKHYSEDDLTLYYYGEARRPADIEKHLDLCAPCTSRYQEIAGTLALIAAPEVPERGDQYGLEVWQRIRHQLPEQETPSWQTLWATLARVDRLGFAAAAAVLLLAAFVAGRVWQQQATPSPAPPIAADAGSPAAPAAAANDGRQRILLTSVADHLDRSERVLTDIMNAPDRGNISTEQQWAEDLIDANRLYRQDAAAVGEQSIADVLDDLERSLLEIVHSPSTVRAADLEQIRRRIDAATLLFKVRVISDELRRREQAPGVASPRTSTRKTS
ncbi:MAG TPA: hypothetical protein VKD69_00480 [Vicinamibacterales bacterium]|nr:hypothetical protein [Vicinamibacterales bacterium]